MLNKPSILTALFLAGAVACGGGESGDELARDLSLLPAESVATLSDQPLTEERTPASRPAAPAAQPERQPPPPPPAPRINVGTVATLFATDTLKVNDAVGSPVYATLGEPLRDSRGREVVPAGATFVGSFARVRATDSTGTTEVMVLTFDRVEFGGFSYPVGARTDSVATRTAKGGVTAGDAAKVGAGAVVGAIAGRVIGGNKTGTAVGAIVGTAAGVGIAVATKGENVYVDAGAPIRITLTEPFVRQ